MKRSPFRSPTLCFLLFAFSSVNISAEAQVNIGYRIHLPTMPQQATSIWVNDLKLITDLDGNPVDALVVGWYGRNDRVGRSAFVYDHFGFIDRAQQKKFWDIEELVGSMAQESGFVSVNSSGRIGGYLISGNRTGIYVDLLDPVIQLKPIQPPTPDVADYMGFRVSDAGDILVLSHTGSWSAISATVCCGSGAQIQVPLVFGDVNDLFFNSSLDLLGTLTDGTVVRHTIFDSDTDGVSDGSNESFENLIEPRGINEFGQFAATYYATSGKGKNRQTQFHAIRIGDDGTLEYEGPEVYYGFPNARAADDLNNSGDVLHIIDGNDITYFQEGFGQPGQFFSSIKQTVIAESDPDGEFASADIHFAHLSDRDITGLGWIAGRIVRDLPDGSTDWDFYLLIPEALPPSISVDDVAIDEGNDGTTTDGQFTVTLSELTGQDVTLFFQIVDGSATAGEDYAAPVSSGLLTFDFAAGETSKTVDFTIIGDNTNEGDETFSIQLSDAFGGATIAKDNGTATIKNDDTKGGGKKK